MSLLLSSGEVNASSSAILRRLLPLPIPELITATPLSLRVVLTSLKSILTIPAVLIISEILRAALLSVLSANWKASETVFLPYISISFSLLTTRRASTLSCSLRTPSNARSILRRPSNLNGIVAMPTVNLPASRAILPTIGAAPVPVPPPIPAVMKTISVSSLVSAFKTSVVLSSAASLAISGLLPAPRPLVILGPSVILLGTGLLLSACSSVLQSKNETPLIISFLYIVETALPPPPPTPMTLIIRLVVSVLYS